MNGSQMPGSISEEHLKERQEAKKKMFFAEISL